MLRRLHIRNYILIDSLDVEFPEGLVIVTGQTGAGKSILLGALALVGGAKADSSMVGASGENCVVEAEFLASNLSAELLELLKQNDIEPDGDTLTLRRVVSRSGRSRSFVDDSPVQLQLLSDICSHLVDIHSQHQSLLLTSRAYQLSVTDSYGGNAQLLEQCSSAWSELQAIKARIEALRQKIAGLEAERDYNQSQFNQLESAHLKEGEMEELEQEQLSLANAEQIKEALEAAFHILDPDDGVQNAMGASLKDARRHIEQAGKFLPGMDELVQRIESARIEIEDIADEIESADASVNADPERLEQVEDRLSLLYTLLKKHSCTTITELIAVRDKYSEALFDTDSLQSSLTETEQSVKQLQATHDEICQRLHEGRLAAAPAMSEAITKSLHFLELDRAVFKVGITDAPKGPTGADAAQFGFSASSEGPVNDVAKCASGGELSRIMLCLKALMADYVQMPTLIFDEIDTGVSGSVADKMGTMICDMGKRMQVLSITHLPQVAAKGCAHFTVTKTYDESGHPHTSVRQVEGEERIMEIARLLSGATITPEAVANARSLIENN